MRPSASILTRPKRWPILARPCASGAIGGSGRALREGDRDRVRQCRCPLQFGQCAGAQWRFDEAIAQYRKALDLQPDRPEIRRNLDYILSLCAKSKR